MLSVLSAEAKTAELRATLERQYQEKTAQLQSELKAQHDVTLNEARSHVTELKVEIKRMQEQLGSITDGTLEGSGVGAVTACLAVHVLREGLDDTDSVQCEFGRW